LPKMFQGIEQFSVASALHTNFYEGWMTSEAVETNAKVVRQLVETLKKLL